MMGENIGVKVCVTGGAGYLASYLIKHLMLRGHTVHATLRTLGDASKVGLLQNLDDAETRLKVFEADIYKPDEFEAAIHGCHFVFHLATPLQHDEANSQQKQYKNTCEAAVAGVKTIADTCIKSTTVKKLIYTSSVAAASPLNDDASGFKDIMDETCWSPPNAFSASGAFISDYIESKTWSEKQVLSYDGRVKVVSLVLGVVGGDTLQSFLSFSMNQLTAQATCNETNYSNLRALEEITSKIPIVHVRDVVDALIFSMETPHMSGRFMCAAQYLKSAEIASILHKHHPHIIIPPRFIEDTKRETRWGSTKLQQLGFNFKFYADKIICDNIDCANRLGLLHFD